ncbi:MAG TPA: TIM barrel protein [Anaerolineales bacterium]|nr:TIM barrel protein [Anaerolineales bacterium]
MIRVANAPVSWGVLEFEGTEGRAGYSLVLDQIRETGYTGTELGDWGFLPTDPTELRSELGQRDLALLGAFVPVALADPRSHAAGREAALRAARLMVQAVGDQPFIVLADDNGRVPLRMQNAGRIRPEHGLSDSSWQTFGEGAARLAESVRRETGLRTVFHHHCAGYVETPPELDRLMDLTDPDVLGLCLDTGHYRFGGGDPAEAVRKHAGRIWHVHFKDYEPTLAARSRELGWDYLESVRRGVFCELGRGEVDFPGVLAGLKQCGYQGWIVVEQDVLPGMGTPKESARRNREYLASIGL